MSRTVPKADPWSRINALETRIAALERSSQLDNSSIQDGALTILDASGNARVQIGKLPNGDFGLMVFNQNGGSNQEFLAGQSGAIGAAESTSSATDTDLATPGPSTTINIGASGIAKVNISSYIGVTGVASSGANGAVSVYVDGVLKFDSMLFLSITSGTTPLGIAAECQKEWFFSGMSPGAHTFEMKYKTSGTSCTFENRLIDVQPL